MNYTIIEWNMKIKNIKTKKGLKPLIFVLIASLHSCSEPSVKIIKLDKVKRLETVMEDNVKLLDSIHVKIGKQVWCLNNLDVVNYKNGNQITNIINKEEWKFTIEGAWCYPENKITAHNSKLYNFMAVIDSRGIAPEGYHIPSKVEWIELVDFLKSKNLESIVLEKYFFREMEGHWRTGGDGGFDKSKNNAVWWSSTDAGSYAYSFSVNVNVDKYSGSISEYSMPSCGFYVRCIKNSPIKI